MILRTALLLSALAVPLSAPLAAEAQQRTCAQSPGKVLEVCVEVRDGRATYEVSRRGQQVLAPATLGLGFAGEAPVRYTGLSDVRTGTVDTSWEQPWGEQRLIQDNHAELGLTLAGDTPLNRHVGVTFRIFDEGIGLRYDYKDVPAGQKVAVISDGTQFRPQGHYTAWWYPALGQERDEYLYTSTDARRITTAETPLTLERDDGLYLSFHEAALVDWPSMLLAGDGAGTLSARLMPWPDGTLAWKTGPFSTPWRTILITDSIGTLADSRIELNLNEPNALGDVSWFKPGKYIGVWWEMHLKRTTWASGPQHGANTANVERYMDFAAKYGFDGVLVEGWNKGWDGDWTVEGDKFSFTEAYPDFDMDAIAAYGRKRGVRLIGHHETGGAVENYARQMNAAFDLYKAHDVGVVKTGYVRHSGNIVDADGGLQWFAGQYMVRHDLAVVEAAAKRHIAIDTHEPVKDTGLRRTYPNWISREGARGQEYNAWGDPTNPPEHMTILPFTRLLGGPMDFTPGIFDITRGGIELTRRVQSTLAVQLAEYVVVYSPVQMAADLPENYEKNPAAFQFIRDVPTDWETTRTLQGKIGDYVVVARQQRGGKDWYLGAITDENARKLQQKLDFLAPGHRYEAQIYADGPGADYRTKPDALTITRKVVTAQDTLDLNLAPGGGAAIRFRALD
ncbi:glycoside hydrolase family 97 protein [Novosphingobium sp. BL-8H]|uniref:glycoside hydrolase family 97 protein n=1 Tax=Novosphingobium sp. BL-8H TaxID=3127640 RepID=UPI003756B108